MDHKKLEQMRMECETATSPSLCLHRADDVLELIETIDRLRGALADIALTEDMTLEVARHKATRVYQELAEPEGASDGPA